jgi:multiple antibiotic resistance protein
MPNHEPLVFFLALFGLYSPLAALASYLPILSPFSHAQVLRLAAGLAVNVAVFVLAAIWAGEPLLEVLGISTAALTATGGIALAFEAVPLMTGAHASATEPGTPGPGAAGAGATDKIREPGEPGQRARAPEPRSVLFTPLTFPLTVGGTTFAFGVAASASAPGVQEKALVSAAAIGYALVTGVTLYAAGHVQRRISSRAVLLLDRIAGVLLTAIAVILLVNGFTELVLSRLGR